MESITGLAIFSITIFIWGFLTAIRSSNKLIKWIGVVLYASLFTLGVYLYKLAVSYKINVQANEMRLVHTASGNLYEHDTSNHQTENGHLVWINFQMKEMEDSWNLRSKMPFNKKDLKGNDLHVTLIRFLASKGLTKDAASIRLLTANEIKAVERGEANVNYQNIFKFAGKDS